MKVKLEEVCKRIYAGGDVPKDRYSEEKTEYYKVPIFANAEKDEGLYGYTDEAREKELSITVAARGTIGYTVIRREPFLPVVRLITVVPDLEKVSERYLFYALKMCKPQSSGTSIPQLTVPDIKRNTLNLLDIAEQESIANRLDKLNGIIKLRTEVISKLDELIRARFVEMFGYPSINNKRWQMGVINEIGSCIAGATPSTKVDEYWNNGTIPWMSSGEVNKGRVDRTDNFITHLGYDKTSTKLVPPKTVVLAMAGQGKTRGMVAITEIELCTNQSICSIVNNEKVDAEYLLYFLKLQYNELRRASTNTDGRGGLNLKIIGNYPIMIPPVALQKYFATFVTQVNKSKFITYSHHKSIYTKLQLCCKMVIVNDFLNTKRF